MAYLKGRRRKSAIRLSQTRWTKSLMDDDEDNALEEYLNMNEKINSKTEIYDASGGLADPVSIAKRYRHAKRWRHRHFSTLRTILPPLVVIPTHWKSQQSLITHSHQGNRAMSLEPYRPWAPHHRDDQLEDLVSTDGEEDAQGPDPEGDDVIGRQDEHNEAEYERALWLMCQPGVQVAGQNSKKRGRESGSPTTSPKRRRTQT